MTLICFCTFEMSIMGTFLFSRIIFGPVYSRRLGISLGINLLPQGCKVCTFNCAYCECGFTEPKPDYKDYPHADLVLDSLEQKLRHMMEENSELDSITFAGNGEPTMHPEFSHIISEAAKLRNLYFPHARLAVLSNSTMITDPEIAKALGMADLCMLKLDVGSEEAFRMLNNPMIPVSLDQITESLEHFPGKYIVQSMFVKGNIGGRPIDNSTGAEFDAWLGRIRKLSPEFVMVYSLARSTPVEGLEKIDDEALERIATKVHQETGLRVEVF
jgi:wyosine [tRNA(Phe)-imidazoG37] synthetase (radical SAM superfamily)